MCIRDRRITRQVQLNILINEVEFENTFLVVKGLSLDVILGNDFLERNGAVMQRHSYRTVSYTHLDVYKRQIFPKHTVVFVLIPP